MTTSEIPLRAVGGNVLMRKVAMDVHRAGLVVYGGKSSTVLQVGEIVGLGGRWTQDRPWFPPPPIPKRTPLGNGSWDPDWKAPDLTFRARPLPARFDAAHQEWLSTLKVGDLVIYVQSRAYDVFVWEGEDIIVYPGNWIHGLVDETSIALYPELRRFEREHFDDAPHTVSKNLHAPAARATGEDIRRFRESR
jgi:hypothetical protein